MTLEISIVVPVYNSAGTLGRTLESLMGQTFQVKEIVLVDDGSTDGSAGIGREFPGVRVISLERNSGPAEARNTGARECSGDAILFVDADVVVPEDLVERIVSDFAGDPAIAAVQTLYHPLCPPEDTLTRYQNYYYHYHISRCSEKGSAVFSTYCVAVMRDIFLELGGFDTRVPEPTVEDEEFGYVLVDNGHTIFIDKDIQVMHLAVYSLWSFFSRRLRMSCAQIKNGLRNKKERLAKKYATPGKGGTHHPAGMIAGILLVWLALLAAAAGAILQILPGGSGKALLVCAAAGTVLAWILNLPFLMASGREYGVSAPPRFAMVLLLDAVALGAGIAKGSLEFLAGRKY